MRLNERHQLILLIGVFSLVLVGEGTFAYFTWNDRTKAASALSKLSSEEKSAREKKKQIPDLNEKARKLASIIEEYAQILPTDAEVSTDAFLEDIDRFTRNTELKLDTAKSVQVKDPTANQSAKQKKSATTEKNFVQYKYRFTFTGTFNDLLKFVNAVENHSRFLQVDAIDIKPQGADREEKHGDEVKLAENPIKDFTIEISTYTYSKTKS